MSLTGVLDKFCARRQKEKRLAFLTQLNHDLRTPLNGIIAGLSLYSDADEKEKEELISMIRQSAALLESTVDQMLAPGTKDLFMNEIKHADKGDILIVEDNIFNQQLLTKMLLRLERTYVVAGTLEAARQQLADHSFHTVFMDVHLPDGFGDELAAEIKRSAPQTKVFMLTADVLLQEKTGNTAFADGILYKPFRLDDIRNLLA